MCRTFLFLMILIFKPAEASEQNDICVKYLTDDGWSKGYSVTGNLISGFDLNFNTGSYNKYDTLSYYVVIFWTQDQASILRLPNAIFFIPLSETNVYDQYEREWKIKLGHVGCGMF